MGAEHPLVPGACIRKPGMLLRRATGVLHPKMGAMGKGPLIVKEFVPSKYRLLYHYEHRKGKHLGRRLKKRNGRMPKEGGVVVCALKYSKNPHDIYMPVMPVMISGQDEV